MRAPRRMVLAAKTWSPSDDPNDTLKKRTTLYLIALASQWGGHWRSFWRWPTAEDPTCGLGALWNPRHGMLHIEILVVYPCTYDTSRGAGSCEAPGCCSVVRPYHVITYTAGNAGGVKWKDSPTQADPGAWNWFEIAKVTDEEMYRFKVYAHATLGAGYRPIESYMKYMCNSGKTTPFGVDATHSWRYYIRNPIVYADWASKVACTADTVYTDAADTQRARAMCATFEARIGGPVQFGGDAPSSSKRHLITNADRVRARDIDAIATEVMRDVLEGVLTEDIPVDAGTIFKLDAYMRAKMTLVSKTSALILDAQAARRAFVDATRAEADVKAWDAKHPMATADRFRVLFQVVLDAGLAPQKEFTCCEWVSAALLFAGVIRTAINPRVTLLNNIHGQLYRSGRLVSPFHNNISYESVVPRETTVRRFWDVPAYPSGPPSRSCRESKGGADDGDDGDETVQILRSLSTPSERRAVPPPVVSSPPPKRAPSFPV